MDNKEVIHTYNFEVLYQHLDIFGHVNHAAYLNIFEEARWDLIESNGYGLNTIIERQQGPTILEVQIRFKSELKFKEKAKIETYRSPEIGKIMPLEQALFDSTGKLCSAATFKFAFFDMKKRKLIEPTQDWLKAIKTIP